VTQAEYTRRKRALLEAEYGRLNDRQREAVFCAKGPLLVLAGAGSGKTSVLTNRIAYLQRFGDAFGDERMPELSAEDEQVLLSADAINAHIERLIAVEPVQPGSILAITFTNKAAREMRERLEGMAVRQGAWVCTFHAACVRMLRMDADKIGYTRAFTILDADDQNTVLKGIMKEKNISDKEFAPRELRAIISNAKTDMLTPDEHFNQSRRDRKAQIIHDVYVAYDKRLRDMNSMDFDDLLLKTLELFSNHPPVLAYYRRRFSHILVDEYQDTNHMQYMLVKLLAASRNVCVVGDDDQSIYGWRGADIRNILDFEKDYAPCTVVKLEQNYRSTNNILEAANHVIDNNYARKKKTLWSAREQGEKIHLCGFADEQEEAAFVSGEILRMVREHGMKYSDFALLYRQNAQSRVPEEQFVKNGVPYSIYGGVRFYERKEVKDVLAYMRVIENPLDEVSLRRVINTPRRGIGDSSIAAMVDAARRQDVSFYEIILEPESSGINSRAQKAILKFSELLSVLMALKETLPVSEFVRQLIDMTGITKPFEESDDEESQARLGNIREMISAVEEYEHTADEPTLGGFLESAALVSDIDALSEQGGTVTLMTMHSAKGLEFPVVFIVGMEEGVFPGTRAFIEEEKLEEERRLCYVGITRAKDLLFLTHASRRMLYGNAEYHLPSRFIDEIPEEYLAVARPAARQIERQPSRLYDQEDTRTPTRVGGRPAGQMPKARAVQVKGTVYVPGDKVEHKSFGEGTVVDVKGDTVRVAFPGQGIKVLSSAIAPMEKV
jgi:DNA helicase-2/ATP-dependent DNA helicase PcrA